MSIFDKYPSKFLKPADFTDGDVVMIKKVVVEVVGQDGSEKPVIYFKEHAKGSVLNVTNAREIAGVYGEDEGIWTGKQVRLTTITVRKPGGGMTDSIFMQPATTTQQRVAAELNDEIPDFA